MDVSWRRSAIFAVTLAICLFWVGDTTPARSHGPVEEAQRHLRDNVARFGLRPDLADLTVVAMKESPGGQHVWFQQTVNGVPVEGATINVSLPWPEARLKPFVTSGYVPAPPLAPLTAARTGQDEAVSTAIDEISPTGVLLRGDVQTELVYVEDRARYRLSWRVLIPASVPLGDWLVYVRADSGKVLSKRNLIQSDDGRVFDPNPLQESVCNEIGACPLVANCETPANAAILTGNFAQGDTQGWSFVRPFLGILAGQDMLKGQYVDVTKWGAQANQANRLYRYACNDAKFEEAMVYYHVDTTQRKIQELGFFNILNGPLPAEARRSTLTCNAFYSPADGGIHMGVSNGTCPDEAEDADAIVHEYGHAVQDDTVNPMDTCAPTTPPGQPRQPGDWPGTCLQNWSIGEGFADFLAAANFASPCLFEWANGGVNACNGDTSPGGRTLVNNVSWTAPNGPAAGLPDGCNNAADEHCVGLVWGGALWDIATAIGSLDTTLRIVLQSHFLLASDPTFSQAKEAVCAADMMLYAGAHLAAISDVFTARGLGACETAPYIYPGFTPTNSTFLCLFSGAPSFSTPCAEDATDLAQINPSDRTLIFTLNANDYNFDLLATYLPPDAYVNPDAVPIGAVAGRAFWDTTMGLTNNPCNSELYIDFFLFNATTNTGNTIDPLTLSFVPSGGEGTLEPLRDDNNNDGIPNHVDRYPSYLNKIFDPDRIGDINVNATETDTVAESSVGRDLNGDGDTNDSVAENGPAAPLTPLARYSGSTIVAGEAWVVQFVVFSPGAFADFPVSSQLRDIGSDPNLGYPVVLIFQDPTAPAAPSSVTDFCSPLTMRTMLYGKSRDNPCTPAGACGNSNTTCSANSTNCQLRNICINDPEGIGVDTDNDGAIDAVCPGFTPEHGDPTADPQGCDADTNEAGCDAYRNPAVAGQAYFAAFNQSLRDSDADGMDGSLDTCPYHNIGTHNPRQAVPNANDPDSDLIPGGGPNGGCDPTPNPGQDVGDAATNYDGDWVGLPPASLKNAGDNCPLWANPSQREQEIFDPFITASPLGGPRNDGIGDACETGSNDFTGNGMYGTAFALEAKCIGDDPQAGGDADDDNDGFCDATETALGSNPDNAASTPENAALVVTFPASNAGSGGIVAPPADGAAETFAQCLNVDDDDSDGVVNDGCPVSGQYLGGPIQVCNDFVDNDGDTTTDSGDAGCSGWWWFSDFDADGYANSEENRIGTNSDDMCGNDGWPSDLFTLGGSFNKLQLQDVTSFVTGTPPFKFGSVKGGPGYDERWNLFNAGGSVDAIDLQDITALVTGARDKPPMFVGQRAFDGPSCPVHP